VIQLDIRTDISQAERFYSNLRKNAVKKAAARAINDVIVTLRTEGARMIKRDHPALRIGDIKSRMNVKRAFFQNLRGSVNTQGYPLSALLFRPTGGRRLKRGVTPVSIMFGKKRGVVSVDNRKGFRIGKFGNEVFVRRDAKGRQVRRFRGPSMPGVFRAKGPEMLALARTRWATTFANRMRYEIEVAKR
jgi:hypothetical protein